MIVAVNTFFVEGSHDDGDDGNDDNDNDEGLSGGINGVIVHGMKSNIIQTDKSILNQSKDMNFVNEDI